MTKQNKRNKMCVLHTAANRTVIVNQLFVATRSAQNVVDRVVASKRILQEKNWRSVTVALEKFWKKEKLVDLVARTLHANFLRDLLPLGICTCIFKWFELRTSSFIECITLSKLRSFKSWILFRISVEKEKCYLKTLNLLSWFIFNVQTKVYILRSNIWFKHNK